MEQLESALKAFATQAGFRAGALTLTPALTLTLTLTLFLTPTLTLPVIR